MNKKSIKAKITKALRSGIAGSKKNIEALVPDDFTAGKIYEAFILATVCEELKVKEGCNLTLVGGSKLTLKSSPGPINNSYPHIEVKKGANHLANIWTDIEFTSLSATLAKKTSLSLGDFHEIDIAVVSPKCNSRPYPEEVFLAVECKNTGHQKSLLREILGVRRELSFLSAPQPTLFSSWPKIAVPADPPSCIAVYSTESNVIKYSSPGAHYGIDFFHLPI